MSLPHLGRKVAWRAGRHTDTSPAPGLRARWYACAQSTGASAAVRRDGNHLGPGRDRHQPHPVGRQPGRPVVRRQGRSQPHRYSKTWFFFPPRWNMLLHGSSHESRTALSKHNLSYDCNEKPSFPVESLCLTESLGLLTLKEFRVFHDYFFF